MPFCAGCGRHISDDESVQGTRGHTELQGSVSWSHVEEVMYCPECAQGKGKTVTVLVWIFGLLLGGFLIYELICWVIRLIVPDR